MKKALSNKHKYRYYKKIRKDGFKQYQTVPYTRRLAIKYYCLECICYDYQEMKNCTVPECPLYLYRLGSMPENKTPRDRTKAIRAFCMECSGAKEYISECPSILCPVHPYRLAGYKTDKESLIPYHEDRQIQETLPPDKLGFLPVYGEGIEDFKEKRAV